LDRRTTTREAKEKSAMEISPGELTAEYQRAKALEVFVTGGDGATYHKWQTAANNGWSDWAGFGTVQAAA
jgi:hypothetical protein